MASPLRRLTRGAQPLSGKTMPSKSSSSSSSLSSARQDRKSSANHKSATPHSRSSEETSEPPRRSQRSAPTKDEDVPSDTNDPEDENAEEEEITRCICGQQDYPGPPQSEAFDGVSALTEDTGSMFIQCDGCSVWQHGGCVGIIEESQGPDKYFCEDCRPKLHDVRTDSRGQNYSLYRPIHAKAARKSSMTKSDEKARRERDALLARASADPVTGRRRATTRSKEHDAEEEQFQRALEESKRDAEGPNSKKSGKRSRDESEENRPDSKRQRRASESIPSIAPTALEDDSEEGSTIAAKAKKSMRSDAIQGTRQAELREKESEREKARQEAAGRRQERAGRRRGDDVNESDDPLKTNAESPPRSSQAPSPPPAAAAEKPRRGPGKRKKLGNNQYTKYKDAANAGASPQLKKRQITNQGGSSGDENAANGESHPGTTNNGTSKNSPALEQNGVTKVGRFGKGRQKGANGTHVRSDEPIERTFTNMQRSLDAMLAFVARQNGEASANGTPPGSETQSTVAEATSMPVGGAVQAPRNDDLTPDRPFTELSSAQMADILTSNVNKWKRLYGHLAS